MENINAVQEALDRGTQEQKEQTQREIADARQKLSHLEMKDANTIGGPIAPLAAPNPTDLDKVQLTPETQANIYSISQAQNYRSPNQNAMNEALSRQSLSSEAQEIQKDKSQEDRAR